MISRGVVSYQRLADAERRMLHRDSSMYGIFAVESGNNEDMWMTYYVIDHRALQWFITTHPTLHSRISPYGGATRLCFDIDYLPGKLLPAERMDILGECGFVYVLVETLIAFIMSGADITQPLHFFVGVTPDQKKTSVHVISQFALQTPDAALRVMRGFLDETTVPIIRRAIRHGIIDQNILTNRNFRIGKHRTRGKWASQYYHPGWNWAWRMSDHAETVAVNTRLQSGIDEHILSIDDDSPLGHLARGNILPWPDSDAAWFPIRHDSPKLARFRQIQVWNTLLTMCTAPVDCIHMSNVEFVRTPFCALHGTTHYSELRLILTDYRRHTNDPVDMCRARCLWGEVEECCLRVEGSTLAYNDPYPTARD